VNTSRPAIVDVSSDSDSDEHRQEATRTFSKGYPPPGEFQEAFKPAICPGPGFYSLQLLKNLLTQC